MCYTRAMSKKKEQTQKTPQGHEIPVPTKDDVFKVLEQAAEPITPFPIPQLPDAARRSSVSN